MFIDLISLKSYEGYSQFDSLEKDNNIMGFTEWGNMFYKA